MRWAIAIALALVAVACWSGEARAERYERIIGVDGGLLFPSFASPSPTAIALAGWNVGAHVEYGLTHDLFVHAAFRVASFDGTSVDHRLERDGRSYTGNLGFSGRSYHPEVGFRYKLFGGYNLAPHLTGDVGYLWATYRDPAFTTRDGRDFGLRVDNFGEGAFTGAVGMQIDYRLFNVAILGVGFRYVRLFGDALLEHCIEAPVVVSYVW